MRAYEILGEDQQLNENPSLILGIIETIMAGWEYAAPLLAEIGPAIGWLFRSGSSLLGSLNTAVNTITKLLFGVGSATAGFGVYKIVTDTETAAQEIVKLLGSAAKYMDEYTILEIAAASVKYSIPPLVFLGVLYAGKELIDSLISEHNATKKAADATTA